MKRLIVISLILLPVLVLMTSTRRGVRYDSRPAAPLAPRPEVAPPEPAVDFRLRFAISDEGEKRSLKRIARVTSQDDDPDETESEPAIRPSTGTRVELASDWMSSEERARIDLRAKLWEQLARWLTDSGVEPGWSPPARLVDPILPATTVDEQDRDYARLYRASATFELNDSQRHRLVREYDRQLAEKRLGILGGVLGFVLACLGVTSAYVRADEMSRGYYTNRLRLVAAGVVGAAGAFLYTWLRQG